MGGRALGDEPVGEGDGTVVDEFGDLKRRQAAVATAEEGYDMTLVHGFPAGDVRLIGWARAALYPEIPHFLYRKSSYSRAEAFLLRIAGRSANSLVRLCYLLKCSNVKPNPGDFPSIVEIAQRLLRFLSLLDFL